MTTADFSLDNSEWKFPTSPETNLWLIQAFNWSKNNFGEIHMSWGLDGALVPLFFLYTFYICGYDTHLQGKYCEVLISTVPLLKKMECICTVWRPW